MLANDSSGAQVAEALRRELDRRGGVKDLKAAEQTVASLMGLVEANEGLAPTYRPPEFEAYLGGLRTELEKASQELENQGVAREIDGALAKLDPVLNRLRELQLRGRLTKAEADELLDRAVRWSSQPCRNDCRSEVVLPPARVGNELEHPLPLPPRLLH